MKTHTFRWLLASVTAVTVTWIVAAAQTSETINSDARLKRGQYLVERVANCADCHTVRDWKGKQDRDRWLRGARLDFKPTRIMPWADSAPDIAGLPMFAEDEQAVRFFETGLGPNKKSSKPPMPQYRLEREDASAVVAYLRSLKPPAPPTDK
jgi:mono/diheme cytochrome c family protein